MRNRRTLKVIVHQRAVKQSMTLSLRKRSACLGLSLGAIVLLVALFTVMLGGTILNGYGKRKAERVYAKAHPGSVLRIGKLDYSLGANRLVAQSVTLSATNATLKAGRISLAGVRWTRLLFGTAALADVLAQASLDATNLDVEFLQARYGLRCARLRASVAGSDLIAEGTEIRALIPDDEFFAASDYRATRFHVLVPECRVSGLAYREILQGKSYRARSVFISQPSFDALVNRDKPVVPFVKSPLMVHEALAAIRQPLQVDSLSITNGRLTYRERVVAGADPGVLSVGAVNVSVEGIANRGTALAAIRLRAQGDLMNAGIFHVQMTIPVMSPDLSFYYSGSLSAMDLTRFNAFLDIAEGTRIKTGSAQEASFDIIVTAGQARGHVRATYKDVELAFLNKQTGSEKGIENRVASFLENALKIRSSNAPNAADPMKEGEVNYTRRPEDEFQQIVWFALRSGVLDVMSH